MATLKKAAQKHLSSLTDAQRALFFASGVFAPAGKFSSEALWLVWRGDSTPLNSAEIEALTPVLLIAEDGLFGFPDAAIHAYALSKLPDALTVQQRHLQYYQMCAADWSDEPSALDDSEMMQFAHALQWAKAGAPDELLPALLAVGQHVPRRFRADLAAWLGSALELLDAKGENWGVAETLRQVGDLSVTMGHYDAAREFYYHALRRYGENALAGQAHTFKGLGDLGIAEENYQAARDFYYKALILYEVVDFKLGQANSLKQLGGICVHLRDFPAGRGYLRQAMAYYAEMDFDLEQAECLKFLGDLHSRQKEFTTARENYMQALNLYEAIDFPVDRAHTLLAMGDMYLQAADANAAQQHYDLALPIFQTSGERRGQAQALRALGNVQIVRQQFGDAIIAFHDAFHRYQQVEAHAEAALMCGLLAKLHVDQNQPQEAVLAMLESLPALNALDDPLKAHEIHTRLRAASSRLGERFFKLWDQLSAGTPIPAWLQPNFADDETAMLPELEGALESPAAFRAAMNEKETGLLRLLSHLSANDRAAWLDKALTLCASGQVDGISHRMRALLLKEMAGVIGQNTSVQLHSAVRAFDAALEALIDDPQEYVRTQNQRVMLLRDMAGMSGENRGELLHLALIGSDAAVEKARGLSAEYTAAQLIRANLLRELAGLRGENRAERMAQAMGAYDELLDLLGDAPLELATVQTNRASLLQEIALLPNENSSERLWQAVKAVATALKLAEQVPNSGYERVVQHMIANLRQNILDTHDPATFDQWWGEAQK